MDQIKFSCKLDTYNYEHFGASCAWLVFDRINERLDIVTSIQHNTLSFEQDELVPLMILDIWTDDAVLPLDERPNLVSYLWNTIDWDKIE